MRGSIGAISLLVTVITVVLLGHPGSSDAAKVSGAGAAEKLTLRLTSERNRYFKGEPIVLSLELSNETQTSMELRGMFMMSPDLLLISSNGGKEFRYQGHSPGLLKVGWRKLEPGTRQGSRVILYPEVSERILPVAGTYDLRIEFSYNSDRGSDSRTVVASNAIAVGVDELAGIDRAAYDYLQTTLRPILNRAMVLEVLEGRRRFSQQFGESVFAKYNSVELAKLYENAGEYQLAEDELYPISDLDFYLREEVDQMLNRLAGKLRKPTVRTKFRRQSGPPPVGGPPTPRPDIRPVITQGLPPGMQPILITPTPRPE
jgi:hypothetical protein